MAVRNFWFNAHVDGRATILSGGPKAKDGGMVIDILQRNEGGIIKPFTVVCSECDGELRTSIFNADGVRLSTHTTKR